MIKYRGLVFPVPFDPDCWDGDTTEVDELNDEQQEALDAAIQFTLECYSF